MSGIGWVAGILGAGAGIVMGAQVQPLPKGWRGMRGKPKNVALAKSVAVGGIGAAIGGAVGYALTLCDCCQNATPLGTPLIVPPVFSSQPPPATATPIPTLPADTSHVR